MAREKLQTLTEPMYYCLLSLTSEGCGVDICNRVSEISNGRVTIGPGTLYALLSRFLESDLIRETRASGRQRWYIITESGMAILNSEFERLKRMVCEGQQALKTDLEV